MNPEETGAGTARRKFPFLEVYLEEWEALPRMDTREAFLRAVFDYGFYQIPPDFSNHPDADLLRLAWNHIERWLVGGWTRSQVNSVNGSKGGAPKGNRNASKDRNKQTSENKP